MSDLSRIEAIFLDALEKGDPDARGAFLDEACRGDAGLRQQVERLLRAHPEARRYLEPQEADATRSVALGLDIGPVAERPGTIVGGRYKLLEPIGEGGMGSVWMAQQTEPVRRTVALKLIKAGMDTKAVLARFEAERQALALMDHPNIAKVLDAGASDEGRPYFVMELVKGVPITRYCDERKLTLRHRLDLFIPVCQAVQHAHQKGVIHRDLKPSNVLVARYDDHPVPKVIDFGVAKAAGQPLTDRTLVTGFGAVVGTPEYMSPEQAQFNQLDVDTRSDIYALGVLLYELLTGSTPVTRGELEKAGLLEVLRMIREQEPPRPSTRLSTAQGLPQIAANRGSEPGTLAGLLRNDLDWIVMKSLEKDRNRRYETATGFAADVQRYLAGEAVQAHPPSAAYRLRKFARKHRVEIITASAFVVLLIAAVGVSSMLAVTARQAKDIAEKARLVAEWNAKLAEYHKNLYSTSLRENVEARVETEIRVRELQVDLDLEEIRADPRVGLLRLARTIQMMPDRAAPPVPFLIGDDDPKFEELIKLREKFRKATGLPAEISGPTWEDFVPADVASQPRLRQLREFATMVALDAGQRFAPALVPLNPDGPATRREFLSPSGERLLTLGSDRIARLWDGFDARPIGTLRRSGEDALNAGLSPDGATAFTESGDGVVRLWETSTGKFLAETEARPDRIQGADPDARLSNPFAIDHVRLSNDRVLTASVALRAGTLERPDPVELWDSRTGRLVADLSSNVEWAGDLQEWQKKDPGTYEFIGDGRWIAAFEGQAITILSAADGRRVARLDHGKRYCAHQFLISPRGTVAATVGRDVALVENSYDGTIYLWDAKTWTLISSTGPYPFCRGMNVSELRFLAEDELSLDYDWGLFTPYRAGSATPLAKLPCSITRFEGDRAIAPGGWLFDMRTWRRIQPPKGRRYPLELARFAPDGRFAPIADVDGEDRLVDLSTEKGFAPTGRGYYRPGRGWSFLASSSPVVGLIRLPPPDRLDIPPDLLALWAGVAVRGGLDDEGAFAKWDEPTWERKRSELASRPVPIPGFPFPGRVAEDRLHWLRREHEEASEADKPNLARLLRERIGLIGD